MNLNGGINDNFHTHAWTRINFNECVYVIAVTYTLTYAGRTNSHPPTTRTMMYVCMHACTARVTIQLAIFFYQKVNNVRLLLKGAARHARYRRCAAAQFIYFVAFYFLLSYIKWIWSCIYYIHVHPNSPDALTQLVMHALDAVLNNNYTREIFRGVRGKEMVGSLIVVGVEGL